MDVIDVEVVSIPVSDQDRARDFYVDVLGFEVINDEVFGEGRRWLQVAPVGCSTTLTLATWFETMPPGSSKGLVLRVANVEEALETLNSHSVPTAHGIESAPWGRFIQIDDPDGNGIVIQQDAR